MQKISRRELGALAAALAAARTAPTNAESQALPQPSSYEGPLTGVTRGLDGRRFDPVAYTVDRYAAAPRRLRFQATSRPDAEAWQQALRAKLTELVGGFPAQRAPLQPLTLETR